MGDGLILARALARPAETVAMLDAAGWTALLAMARAEQLLGSLAWRLDGLAVPPAVARILADARAAAEQGRTVALWEAEMVRRALAPLGVPVVLLKGTAFVAAGLAAGQGRAIGDCDVLLPRDRLREAEAALLAHGWRWVKVDPYDDAYYRRWMHELPPLVHDGRGRMLDVHHTILPLTARRTPDAAALVADAVRLEGGHGVLSAEDMVVHAALHLLADGDLSGGLRNLWDIDRLLREFADADDGFWLRLDARARRHQATAPVMRAARAAAALFDTPVPDGWRGGDLFDGLVRRRLLARDGWGRPSRPGTRGLFYLRGHAMRMPPLMLARHLWTKWRRA
jgi:hypothetical protein